MDQGGSGGGEEEERRTRRRAALTYDRPSPNRICFRREIRLRCNLRNPKLPSRTVLHDYLQFVTLVVSCYVLGT